MENYYELFSLDRAQSTEKIREQLLTEKKKQINRQNNAPTNDKRYEAEKLLEKISLAEEVFADDSKRKEYDQKLLSHASGNKKANNGSYSESERKTNYDAKPTRKLLEGIDLDNGNFFKTVYGKYSVVSYEEAFEEINDTMSKMLKLGPAKGQTQKAYFDEVLRLARMANHNRSALSEEILGRGIEVLIDGILDATDASTSNILSQNIFYYANELFGNRKSTYDLEYFYVSIRDSVFWLYQCNMPVYREYVKAFYMVNKLDKSMPHGYYDLSYVTKKNENYLDIYFLEILDYYTRLFIENADNGAEIEHIDTIKKGHELYVGFRETLDPTMPNYKKDKKKLLEIYKDAISYVPEKTAKDEAFILANPYNAGIGYAIGIALGDNKRSREAIGKLTFGKSVLSTLSGEGKQTNGALSQIESQKRGDAASFFKAILVNTVVPIAAIIGMVCLEQSGHYIIAIFVALAIMMLQGNLVAKSDHVFLNDYIYQFVWAVSVMLPVLFLIRRGHVVYALISIIIFCLSYSDKKSIEAAGQRYTTSYMIACSMRIILPCIMIYFNHMYTVIALLVLVAYGSYKKG